MVLESGRILPASLDAELGTTIDPRACELLKAAVRSGGDEGRPSFAELAQEVHEWDLIVQLALEHRVIPQLAARLSACEASVPLGPLQRIRGESDRNTFHCLANTSELLALVKAFEQAGFPAMPFKGVSLAASVYGGPTMRAAGDLDFLVFPQDLKPATRALLERGYELKTPVRSDGSPAVENYYEFHFERPSDGMVVELRWRLELTQPRFRRNLGMEWIWPRRRPIRVAGQDVPDMAPIDKLLVLCMHGSKHQWSRLLWISDVARLIENEPQLDWIHVTREAKRRGLRRATALGTLLAVKVCGMRIPDKTLRIFAADGAARQLSSHFASRLFDAPGEIPANRMPYNFRLLDSGDRLRLFLSGELIRPNDRDVEAIRLPNSLRPLYFLIRPWRILFDKSAR